MAVEFDAGDTSRDLNRALLQDLRRGLLAGFAALVNASPVGAPQIGESEAAARSAVSRGYVGGHFRRNWQVGAGLERVSEIEGGEGSSAAEVIAAGSIEINQVRSGQVVYITNNAPYSTRLAEGHSRQAPPGWVDAGVDIIGDVIAGSSREV